MEYSNKLKLDEIISKLDNYVIIKKPEYFPNYYDFSDLDIIIKKEDISKIINIIRNELINYNGFFKIIDTNGHLQIDYYEKDHKKLNFKFDFLYDLSIAYKKIKFKDNFIDIILENKEKDDNIYVPFIEHELIIRWIEYKEYIDVRQDKIKHLNYINKYDFDLEKLKNKYLL